MTRKYTIGLIGLGWIALTPATHAGAEFIGRFSLVGSLAHARDGDAVYNDQTNNIATIFEQSLRLMLDGGRANSAWSIHLRGIRQRYTGHYQRTRHSSELFRLIPLADDYVRQNQPTNATVLGFEIDRLRYEYRFDNLTLSLGRQPIDWGSGSFWQPLNVFGAFFPTTLDTDFKPGIDSFSLQWFSGNFSSLTVVYAISPRRGIAVEDSLAVHFRHPMGKNATFALLAGRVVGDNVAGVSFAGDWAGLGWRVEGVYYDRRSGTNTDLSVARRSSNKNALFWIAGVNYQFSNSTLLTLEWHDNGLGARSRADLQNDVLALTRRVEPINYLQQHLSRRVLGLSVQHQLTPLLSAGYTMLTSVLARASGGYQLSANHQFSLTYSAAEEMELLFALAFASGPGQRAGDVDNSDLLLPRSEFGQNPFSAILRFKLYF